MILAMLPSNLLRPILIISGLIACLVLLGYGWWLCECDQTNAFLPIHTGAKWIVDPIAPENRARRLALRSATYRKEFVVDVQASDAVLSICAFKCASVTVNGKDLLVVDGKDQNWKLATSVSVASLLKIGTNVISAHVTNSNGPPALWLRLQLGKSSVASDESWVVSTAGAVWQAAACASGPVVLPSWSPMCDTSRTSDSVRRVWPALALFTCVSLAVFLGVLNPANRRASASPSINPSRWMLILYGVVIAARTALFIHDVPRLSHSTGFDEAAHEQYVKFIQEKDALPLPNDGWEMHQPPLYYLICAELLTFCEFTAGTDDAQIPLRSINGVLGGVQCWLSLLCLRRLFPGNWQAQAAGFLVAAFLPPEICLSMYITNDPLAGVFITLAFYFFLRLEQVEKSNAWLYIGLGTSLGTAILAKLSASLAVPAFFFGVGWRLVTQRKFALIDWSRSMGVMALALVLVSGWHYWRVWMQIGALPLPNSQTGPAMSWWADPGFRTGSYYWHFGQALVSPLFSGVHSFADGIYSTLWGDGLIGGRAQMLGRPPWNYDLMNAGYLISLAPTVLTLIGLAVFFGRSFSRRESEGMLVLGICFLFAAGIFYLTLRTPYLAAVKAFYAIPAIVPFSALFAAGWNWLAQKFRGWQAVLWCILLVWTFTNYASYWIRDSKFETLRGRALVQLQQNEIEAGIDSVNGALNLRPDDPDSHCIMAEALLVQNQPVEAMRHYEAALKVRPDDPDTLADVAALLCQGEKPQATRAVELARRACELTAYRQVRLVDTLAASYACAGQFEAAVRNAELAFNLAVQTGDDGLIQRNREELEKYRTLQKVGAN